MLGPEVYVIVREVPVSSVYVNGFGNSISSTDTGWNIIPVWSELAEKSVYCDIAFSTDIK